MPLNTPRLSRCLVNLAKKPSTALRLLRLSRGAIQLGCRAVGRNRVGTARRGTALAAALAAGMPASAPAQDIEARAYSPAPVGTNFLGALYLHSTGGASFDPDLPLKNARVTIESPAVYYSRTFDLFGHQASAGLVLPYAWADAKAEFLDQPV